MAYESMESTFRNMYNDINDIKCGAASLRSNFMMHLYEDDYESDSRFVESVLTTITFIERAGRRLDEYTGYFEMMFKNNEKES